MSKQHEKIPTPPSEGTIARMVLLEKAINDYGRYILGYLYRLTGDPHTADDLAQEFWLGVNRYFEPTEVVADDEELPELDQIPDDSQKFAQPSTPEEVLELKAKFWERFPGISLTEEQKEAVWLNKYEKLTLTEVGNRLGVSAATIFRWVEDVKVTLRKFLNEEES